jgi:hypothetical protein
MQCGKMDEGDGSEVRRIGRWPDPMQQVTKRLAGDPAWGGRPLQPWRWTGPVAAKSSMLGRMLTLLSCCASPTDDTAFHVQSTWHANHTKVLLFILRCCFRLVLSPNLERAARRSRLGCASPTWHRRRRRRPEEPQGAPQSQQNTVCRIIMSNEHFIP